MTILKMMLTHWRGNQKWTIQRNWQHRVHKTKTQHNMCWTPLYASKHK